MARISEIDIERSLLVFDEGGGGMLFGPKAAQITCS